MKHEPKHIGGITRNGQSLVVWEHATPKECFIEYEARVGCFANKFRIEGKQYIETQNIALRYIERDGISYSDALINATWDMVV